MESLSLGHRLVTAFSGAMKGDHLPFIGLSRVSLRSCPMTGFPVFSLTSLSGYRSSESGKLSCSRRAVQWWCGRAVLSEDILYDRYCIDTSVKADQLEV